MRLFPARFAILALLALSSLPALAENWPHWRGPFSNGSTTETNLPVRWSKAENTLWTAPLPGRSGATPVIWDDHVFLPSPDADGNLLLLCFRATDGSLRWQRKVAAGNTASGKNNMASPSVATDGRRAVALFGTGDLAAYDFDGRQLWSKNLARQYGKFALMWLYGSSPVLYRDKLYFLILQRADPGVYRHAVDDKPRRESFLLCLDPQTGRELWRQARKTDAVAESQDAYSTPIIHTGSRGTEILIYGADYVTAHDPQSGKELWRSVSLDTKKSTVWRTIVSPVAGPELVYACLPRANSPVVAVRPGKAGAAASVAWQTREASSDVPTPLFYRGKLFVLDGNRQMMTCLDPASGKTVWRGRLEAEEVFSASPTGADGNIYCIGEGGTVVVLSAGDEFKTLARFTMDDPAAPGGRSEGGPILSSIAVANGRLYVRTARNLVCVGTRATRRT